MSGNTVYSMRSSSVRGTGPIPTQTYYASNIAGGPVPPVGAAQGSAGTSLAGQFGTVKPHSIVLIILILIAGGYLLHHFSFEESVRAG